MWFFLKGKKTGLCLTAVKNEFNCNYQNTRQQLRDFDSDIFGFHPPLKAVNSLHHQSFIQEATTKTANKRATKSCFTKENKTINGPDKPKETEGLALANVMLLTS